jgi:hypothetical protein
MLKTAKEQTMWVIASIALTLVVSSSPCASCAQTAPARVSGHVYLAGTLQSIEGAYVQTDDGNHTTFTDSSGYYHLTLPSGDYVIGAFAANNTGGWWLVTVREDDVRWDFYLLPTENSQYEVSGSVFEEESGELVTSAFVSIPSIGYGCSASGTYSFTLPNGTFELVVSAEGYKNATAEVTVDGSNVTKDLSISRLNKDGTRLDPSWIVMFVAVAGTAIAVIAALRLSGPRKRP